MIYFVVMLFEVQACIFRNPFHPLPLPPIFKGEGAGTFSIKFFLSLSFLHLEIVLLFVKLVMHLRKIFFLPL